MLEQGGCNERNWDSSHYEERKEEVVKKREEKVIYKKVNDLIEEKEELGVF